MSNTTTIARNTYFLFVSEIVGNMLSFFLLALMSRHFLEIGLGKHSFALSFASILLVFTEFGTYTYMIREISKDKSQTQKIFSNIMGLRLVLSLGVFIVGIPIAWLMAQGLEVFLVIIITMFAVFLYYFSWNMIGVFQAYEKMQYIAIGNVIEKASAFLIGFIMIKANASLGAFVATFALSALVYFLSMRLFFIKNIGTVNYSFDITYWKSYVKSAFPFWISAVFISLIFKIEPFMLSLLADYAATGWYSASERLVLSLNFLPVIITTAVFPAMSRFHKENKPYLRLVYEKSFRYLFVSILPIAIGTSLLSERIIIFIYRESFIQSAPLLVFLIWAEVFIFLSFLSGFLLNAIDKQHIYAGVTGSVFVLMVILNLSLIPAYKGTGAAISFLISSCILFLILYFFVSKEYKVKIGRIVFWPCVSGIIMTFVILLLQALPILIIVPIAGLVYGIFLVLFRTIGKEEIDLIKAQILKKI